jgi:pimeloyl-ACP methyl ester carboxylesterase
MAGPRLRGDKRWLVGGAVEVWMECRIRDLDVYCDVRGEGAPVVMVHGMGVDHRVMTGCMEPVFEARDEAWKRIYFDLPGMGRTQGADWIACSDDMVDLILSLIDQVIPGEPFLIAGESYGGYLVEAIVRQRPEDVDGVLLICPLVEPDDARRDLPESSILRSDGALADALEDGEREMFDLFVVDQTKGNWIRFRDEILAGFEAGDQAFTGKIRTDPEAYALSYALDDPEQPFDKPSLILTGRQDCLVGYRDTLSLLDRYTRGTFAVLDRAGHAMQIEQDRLFDALVHEWLDRVLGDRGAGAVE